jgi:hypothetical protein
MFREKNKLLLSKFIVFQMHSNSSIGGHGNTCALTLGGALLPSGSPNLTVNITNVIINFIHLNLSS